jgi:serine phosphatase RsbU (regulator of sigma subunit)/uncharacterized protein HemY
MPFSKIKMFPTLKSKRRVCFFLTSILSVFISVVGAQTDSTKSSFIIDSLLKVIKTESDTSQIKSLNMLSRQYIDIGDNENAIRYANETEQLCKKENYSKGLAICYGNFTRIHLRKGDYTTGLTFALRALKISEEIDYKKGEANAFNDIGSIHLNQKHFAKAIENYEKGLKIREQISDTIGVAASYNNLGVAYTDIGNNDKALICYLKCLNSLQKMANGKRKKQYLMGIGASLNNIGLIYIEQGKNVDALESFLKALQIKTEISDKFGIASTYGNIGRIYTNQKKFKEALSFLTKELDLSRELGAKALIQEAYTYLAELHEKNGDYKSAFNYFQLSSEMSDTLLNDESSKQIAEMNTKYNSEKKDKELLKKDAEITQQQADFENKKLQRNAFIGSFVLLLILVFYIYKGYREKRMINKQLEEKNKFIETQKLQVEEKNEKITDSINYAQRIQQAILPDIDFMKELFPDCFIFYRARDIISGDFYWCSKKENKYILAVADCTGHGVPGAFMSMIGNTLLNEIVNIKNIHSPAEILSELNKNVVDLLNQNTNDLNTQDDGMDITILSFDKTSNSIEYAAANHFSYFLKDNKLNLIKGDIYSIGGMFTKTDIQFSNTKIQLEKNDILYLFTDGFIDQFGGKNDKKFLSEQFEQLLKGIQNQPMEEQKKSIITAFDNWKGDNKQLDDILVVGIKI